MMRLLEARLTDVRRFADLTVTFAEGLNLILGPNGAGKSTLAEAIMFALTERYGNDGVRSHLAPIDHPQARPSVALVFVVDGTRYELVKRFGGSRGRGECTLDAGSSLLAGEDAQRALAELLHFVEPTGRKGNLGLQQGIPRLFWVAQGTSTDVAGSFQAVHSFLEPLLGIGTAAELEAAAGDLRARVDAELRAVEGTSRSQSQLDDVADRITRLRDELEELARRRDELEETRARLQQAESELGQIRSQGQEEHLRRGLEEADAYAEEVRALKETRAQLDQACVRSRDQLEVLEARRDRAAELEQIAQRLHALEADLEVEEAAERTAGERLRQLRERAREAREETERAKKAFARRELLDRRAALLAQRDELEEQLRRLDELQAARRAHELRLQELEVGPGADALAALEGQMMIAEAKLHAGSARVRVEVRAPERVLLDGVPLGASTEFRLESSRVVEVPERVRLDLIPPDDAGELRRQRDELREELEEALSQIGAASVQEVRQREEERAQHERERDRCQDAEAAIGARSDLEARRDECLRGLEALPSLGPEDEVLAPLEELRAALGRAEEAERAIQSELETESDRQERRGHALRARQDERIGLRARLSQLERDLEAAPYDPDELARLSGQLEQDQRTLHDIEAELAAREDPRAVSERARERLLALERRVAELQTTIGVESSSVQRLWPDQSERELQEQLEVAERQHQQLELRARGLKLIAQTIDELRHEQRETLQAPVRQRIEHYLRGLASDATVELDGALAPGAVVLPHVRFGFDQLSYGTREQVALASRLAFADVLADKGVPLVVMLDDALLHSDLVRLDWMKEVLLEASTRHQLLVLSCRPDLFADLAAHRVELGGAVREA